LTRRFHHLITMKLRNTINNEDLALHAEVGNFINEIHHNSTSSTLVLKSKLLNHHRQNYDIFYYQNLRIEEKYEAYRVEKSLERDLEYHKWIEDINSNEHSDYSTSSSSSSSLNDYFKNSFNLIELIQSVYKTEFKCAVKKNSQTQQQMLHHMKNFELCLRYLRNERGINCSCINVFDLINGDRKALSTLLYLIKNDREKEQR
jgi:hypothetical protein